MKTSIFMMLASLVAAPVAAASSENDIKPIHHLHHVYRHAQKAIHTEVIQPNATAPAPQESSPAHRAIHHRTLVARAEAPVPATIFPRRGPSPYPLNYHQTDGLSRNPDDCLKYGCIDNGGN
jgi:hypothetical protein